MEPLISVIVPVYNVEEYVEACIQSIIAQTYRNIEIIIVDDGSNDKSGFICDRMSEKDARIAVYHFENNGVASARNAGVELSNGEYIAFVDSDDIVAPDYLRFLYDILIENDADISCCKLEQIRTHEFNARKATEDGIMLCTGMEACRIMLSGTPGRDLQLSSACLKLYKRSILSKYKFPLGRKFEDTRTICRFLYESDRVVISDAVLYGYYQNTGGIISDSIKANSPSQNDRIWANVERAEYFERNNDKKLAKLAWKKTINLMYAISIFNNGRYDEDIRRLVKNKAKKRTIDGFSFVRYSIYSLNPRAYRQLRAIIKCDIY